jgi:type II secretory pathway predicted ATPase ExeA
MSQRQIAGELGISLPAVNRLLKHGIWPAKEKVADDVHRRLFALLEKAGIPRVIASPSLTFWRVGCMERARQQTQTPKQEEQPVMLRKQTLTPKAREAFGLRGDPFGEVRSSDDVYLDGNTRYVRECIYMTAKHGGMTAVIGESGSGKSTLRRDFIDRIKRESLPIVTIEPYIISMDEDRIGKPLRADHIVESVLHTLAPSQRIPRSQETRYRQLHKVLKESARAGNKHVLIIEEAHDLHGHTLKHLKRFYELEDGFDRLLAIILFGQSELKTKLGEVDPKVREVVQRMDLVELRPMVDLDGYLRHRLERANLDFDKLFAPDAVDALRLRHSSPTPRERGQAREAVSMLYPLAVGNTLVAACNLAAELGMDKITGDIVRRV